MKVLLTDDLWSVPPEELLKGVRIYLLYGDEYTQKGFIYASVVSPGKAGEKGKRQTRT